jgi:hypothetical protein
MRMSHIVIPCLPRPTTFFHIISQKARFLEKKILNIKRDFIFSMNFFWNILHSKKNWARYDKKTYVGLHVKYPLCLSVINETWIFSKDFKIPKFQITWKSVHMELSCSMRTDRNDEANSRFLQFCERPQKWSMKLYGTVLRLSINGWTPKIWFALSHSLRCESH